MKRTETFAAFVYIMEKIRKATYQLRRIWLRLYPLFCAHWHLLYGYSDVAEKHQLVCLLPGADEQGKDSCMIGGTF